MTSTSNTGENSNRCKYCGKELKMTDYALPGHKPMLVPTPCDCEKAQEDARREEEEAERSERIEAFSMVWSRSGVPNRFLHVRSNPAMAEPLFGGKWLYLCGENGRGKTYAACQAAKAYLVRNTKREVIHDKKKGDRLGSMRCGTSFHFTEAQSLLSEVTSSWSRWDMNEDEVKSRWAGVDLLILDDLGKGVPSPWAAETLFDIINRRWSNNNDVDQKSGLSKPRLTIITSQYGIDELAERYRKAGAETLSAMISRLRGECREVRLGGDDKRLSGVLQ